MNPDKEYTVIELGSGTGIAGLGFLKLFQKSRVHLTDYSEASLKLIKENAEVNGFADDQVLIHKLKWGKDETTEFMKLNHLNERPVDLVICSDVIYMVSEFDNLI